MADHVMVRSKKKLKSLFEFSNIVHVYLHVLTFNMILISSQKRVLTSSYPFLGKFGREGKGSSYEKAKNFNRGCLSMPSESTGF